MLVARGFVQHAVFALHFLAFQMLAFAAVFVLAALVWRLAQRSNPAAVWVPFDQVISIAELVSTALYATLALRRVHGGSLALSLMRAGLLTAAAPWILWAYRCALFLITYWTT